MAALLTTSIVCLCLLALSSAPAWAKVGTITEFAIPTAASFPIDITAGPDGNLWFTEASGNQIGRITTSGVITQFPLPTTCGSNTCAPAGIAAGPDGNLWFTEENGNQIGRITPTATNTITEFAIPTFGSTPADIAAGPDGNLWFTELGGNQIGRITPTAPNTITGFVLPTTCPPSSLGCEPQGITAGPAHSSSVWFTERDGNKIGKIATK